MTAPAREAGRAPAARAAHAPPRVLHVVAPMYEGGLERVVTMLAVAQRAAGVDARVVAVLDRAGAHPFVERLAAHGVPVQALVVSRRGYLEERRAIAALAATAPDTVVHTHGYRPDVIAASAARRAGRATVSTVHGFTGGGWRNRIYEALQVRALRRADAVVAVAATVARRLEGQGVPPARLATLANAFAPYPDLLDRAAARAALGVAPDAVQVAWVGRVSHEKGADVLVRALPALADLPVRVSIVGDGPARGAVEAEAARLGVADRLQWHGMVAGAGRFLRAFDAFVLSSRTEGTPIALLEAMAAGVPIVATRVGGVPDVVTSDHAELVPSEQPDALAAAVRATLASPAAARARAGRAAARVADAYGVSPWVASYDRIYADARAASRLASGSRER